MSAYLVVDLDIRNPDAIADYRSKALPLVERVGGHLIALDESPLDLEGWPATNMLILQFPDMDAIRRLFSSPEYAPLARQRRTAAGSRIVALHGV